MFLGESFTAKAKGVEGRMVGDVRRARWSWERTAVRWWRTWGEVEGEVVRM